MTGDLPEFPLARNQGAAGTAARRPTAPRAGAFAAAHLIEPAEDLAGINCPSLLLQRPPAVRHRAAQR
ncbi:hypothetical protein RV134_310141 [Roseovarius sp. EC-HK134]|nr:hypothetical protein RV420_360248 [Roseovarius sp. EC-SD190]VVT19842.1 hypothetical protein RV134_310141 [Roseovarius sp. EC-HK134]